MKTLNWLFKKIGLILGYQKYLEQKQGHEEVASSISNGVVLSCNSSSFMQPLEKRVLYDAALGVELAAIVSDAVPDAVNIDIDLSYDVDQNTDVNALLQSDMNIDQFDLGNNYDLIADDTKSLVSMNNNNLLGDYASYDKSLVKEVIFVDNSVDNYIDLLDGVDLNKLTSGQLEIKIIENSVSGVDQISDYLAQYRSQLDSVHIVSHGASAELLLGSDVVNTDSLGSYSSKLSVWGNSFASNGDILFYGCSVAQGLAGQQFVKDLHDIIKTDIAASSDITGNSNLGGDWEFEVKYGEITAKNAFSLDTQNLYNSILATYTVTNLNDTGAGSLRQAITDANATVGVDDVIEFNSGLSGTITITSALPTITDTVTINGFTASGASEPTDPTYPSGVTDPLTDRISDPTQLGTTIDIGSTLSFTNDMNNGISVSNITIAINANFVGSPILAIQNSGADGTVIKGLEIYRSSTTTVNGISLDNVSNVIFSDNQIHNIQGGSNVFTIVSAFSTINNVTDLTISNNVFNTNTGIIQSVNGSSVDSVTIQFNDFINNSKGAGLNNAASTVNMYYNNAIVDSTTPIVNSSSLYNSNNTIGTFIGNRVDDYTLGVRAGSITAYDNYITDLDGYAVQVNNNAQTSVVSNNVIDNTNNSNGKGILINAGSTTVSDNTITNSAKGVVVAAGTGSNIFGNIIYGIADGLPIDLGNDGINNPLDSNDVDTGANNLQNYPEISSAEQVEVNGINTLRIIGTLNSEASKNYRIDFYSKPTNDPGVELRTYLGSTTTTTNAISPYTANFTFDSTSVSISDQSTIFATATELATLSTSEVMPVGEVYNDQLTPEATFLGLNNSADNWVDSNTSGVFYGTSIEPAADFLVTISRLTDGIGTTSSIVTDDAISINSNGTWSYSYNLTAGIYKIDFSIEDATTQGDDITQYIVIEGTPASANLNLGFETGYSYPDEPFASGYIDNIATNPAVLEYTNGTNTFLTPLVATANLSNDLIAEFLPNSGVDFVVVSPETFPDVETNYNASIHAFSGNTANYDTLDGTGVIGIDKTPVTFGMTPIVTADTTPGISGTFNDNYGINSFFVVISLDATALFSQNNPDFTPSSTGGGYTNSNYILNNIGPGSQTVQITTSPNNISGTWSIADNIITALDEGVYDVVLYGLDPGTVGEQAGVTVFNDFLTIGAGSGQTGGSTTTIEVISSLAGDGGSNIGDKTEPQTTSNQQPDSKIETTTTTTKVETQENKITTKEIASKTTTTPGGEIETGNIIQTTITTSETTVVGTSGGDGVSNTGGDGNTTTGSNGGDGSSGDTEESTLSRTTTAVIQTTVAVIGTAVDTIANNIDALNESLNNAVLMLQNNPIMGTITIVTSTVAGGTLTVTVTHAIGSSFTAQASYMASTSAAGPTGAVNLGKLRGTGAAGGGSNAAGGSEKAKQTHMQQSQTDFSQELDAESGDDKNMVCCALCNLDTIDKVEKNKINKAKMNSETE